MDTALAFSLPRPDSENGPQEEELYSAGDAFDPTNWYAWEPIRRALVGRDLSIHQIGDVLGHPRTKQRSAASMWSDAQVERQSLPGRVQAMVERGLIEELQRGNKDRWYARYKLTSKGWCSLERPGPPKPEEMSWREFCGSLAFAVAELHKIGVHAMLREEIPAAKRARSQLCAALRDAGWTPQQIACHYGLTLQRVEAAIANWDRK